MVKGYKFNTNVLMLKRHGSSEPNSPQSAKETGGRRPLQSASPSQRNSGPRSPHVGLKKGLPVAAASYSPAQINLTNRSSSVPRGLTKLGISCSSGSIVQSRASGEKEEDEEQANPSSVGVKPARPPNTARRLQLVSETSMIREKLRVPNQTCAPRLSPSAIGILQRSSSAPPSELPLRRRESLLFQNLEDQISLSTSHSQKSQRVPNDKPRAILQVLLANASVDDNLQLTSFLLCYRSILSPLELLDLLFSLYDEKQAQLSTEASAEVSSVRYSQSLDQAQAPFFYFLSAWISGWSCDFKTQEMQDELRK